MYCNKYFIIFLSAMNLCEGPRFDMLVHDATLSKKGEMNVQLLVVITSYHPSPLTLCIFFLTEF